MQKKSNYHISFSTSLLKNSYPGTYIALEGIDGSGKTSQIEPLKKYLEEQRKSVVTVRFPRKDEGLLATVNKSVIQGKSSIPKSAYQYIFSADYVMLLDEVIVPALKEGKVVISDRFHCWSSLAYGLWDVSPEYDTNVAQSLLVANGLLSTHYQFFVPDITLYSDVSVETAMKRMVDKAEKEIYEKREVLEKIKKGYDWLLQEFPEQFQVIDAEKSLEDVTYDMLQVIERKLQKK